MKREKDATIFSCIQFIQIVLELSSIDLFTGIPFDDGNIAVCVRMCVILHTKSYQFPLF